MMVPELMQLEADLVQFLQSRRLHRKQITSRTDLLDEGLLDSLLLVDLIFQIEDRYGVRFESEHVSSDNFRTVYAIANLVMDQLQSRDGNRPEREAVRAAAED
jgi:acyl carrier protein